MSKEKTDLRAKLNDVPHKPGVYLMRDRFSRVIYVGKARDLRKRLAHYFTPSGQTRAELKTRALIDSIWDFEYHLVRSDAEAVLYEGRLIKEFRPKYNVSFRDDKRFLLVRVNLHDPLPRLQLTRLRKEDGARYFGPYAHSSALRSTLQALRKRFGLRSCRPQTPGETDYKHCHDDVIKNCSAPCIARISQADYHARMVQACEVLEGESKEMRATVEKEMHAAAAKLDFEKAAQLRNLLADLKQTTQPMTRFTRRSLPGSLDPESAVRALQDALRLTELPRVMECFDISNITSNHIVASMVRFRDGVPDRANYRRYRIQTVKSQNDFASMAEVVRRRYSRVLGEARQVAGEAADFNQEEPPEAVARVAAPGSVTLPNLIIVDGGKGQLSSACRELQTLGLHAVPIIGLAKQFEEIYRPGESQPLRLPEDSHALYLLQRIRDEAHRFANGYHSLLLKRRISESRLDEIAGISEARKKALLAQFGSVIRLRKASVEQIAAVPGISPQLAETLLTQLNRPHQPST